jgi:hypothetical protein
MRAFIESVEFEYRRYKTLSDKSMAQVDDREFFATASDGSNSIAAIAKHVGGNLASRFTDFLTTDGEKPWRKRDEEFEAEGTARADVLAVWENGWRALFDTLADLSDADLNRPVVIRGEGLPVHAALHRSLAHTASHAGQIQFAAKAFRGAGWSNLSVPRGQSTAFNQAMAEALQRPRTS